MCLLNSCNLYHIVIAGLKIKYLHWWGNLLCIGTKPTVPYLLHKWMVNKTWESHVISDSVQWLGCTTGPEQQESSSTELTFLGITINTAKQILSLPSDKLTHLMETLHHWVQHKTCTCRELVSLIGILQHTCTVILMGRTL